MVSKYSEARQPSIMLPFLYQERQQLRNCMQDETLMHTLPEASLVSRRFILRALCYKKLWSQERANRKRRDSFAVKVMYHH